MLQSIFGYRQQNPVLRQRSQVKQVSATELYQNMAQDDTPLLIDVRTPEEYQLDGHIAGSRLLPLHTLMQRVNELPKDRPIVCVCRSGSRSQVACEQLAAQGFTDLTNLNGGMIGWHRAGLPSK